MEADERKKQIRQAAMKVFLDKGFRNTVMNDIMEATGLSRGGLYHHYSSTYEILYEIMIDGNKDRKQILEKSILTNKNMQYDELFAEMVVEKMIAKNEFISIYAFFLEEMKYDKKLEELYKNLKDNFIEEIVNLLKKTRYLHRIDNKAT